MSDITCLCGKLTNTAVSDWCDPRRKDGKAYKCYAAWDGKKWVKGCAYDKCDSYTKQMVDSLLSPNLRVKHQELRGAEIVNAGTLKTKENQ